METKNDFVIKVTKGGPLVVSGGFKLILPSGEEKVTTEKAFLCRCGQSKNKPYCDGTHTKIDFDH